jgi:hypothetical protein
MQPVCQLSPHSQQPWICTASHPYLSPQINIIVHRQLVRPIKLLALFYFKKFVASRIKSKWRQYSRWRPKCLHFSPNIFENDIFVHFSFVFIYFGSKFKNQKFNIKKFYLKFCKKNCQKPVFFFFFDINIFASLKQIIDYFGINSLILVFNY